jgi:uncharacterized protein (TIGR02099 family)
MERVKRRWWTRAVTLLAAVVIAGAVISGLFQLAVLALPSYRADLSAWVTHVADRPVQIGGVNLGWRGIRPRLDLTDITLFSKEGDESLTVDRLSLAFSLPRLLIGDTLPERLEVAGLTLDIDEGEDGRWSVAGFQPGENGVPDAVRQAWAKQLARFGHVVVRNCTLVFSGPHFGSDGQQLRVVRIDLEQRRGGFEIDGRAQLPVTHGDLLELSAGIDGPIAYPQQWNGDFELDFERLRPQGWLAPYLQDGVQIGAENLNGSIGGRVRNGRVAHADVEIDSDGLIVARDGHYSGAKTMRLRGSIADDARGWLADLRELRFDDDLLARGSLRWTQDGAGRGIDINADELHLGRLMPWTTVWRDAPPAAAQAARLSGTLRNIVLRLRTAPHQATRYSATARLDDIALAPGGGIGLAHVSGEASANESGGQLRLQQVPVELQLPNAIAQPIAFDGVDAQILWSRGSDNWRIGSPAFTWKAAGTDGSGRFDLRLPADHDGSPTLDLLARFTVDDLDRLKPYMALNWSEHTRDWLQNGLTAGRVSRGELTINGPLADFPFAQHRDGVFKVDADISGADIKIGNGWPTLDNIAAHLSLLGASLQLDATSASIGGNKLDRAVARIDDFAEAMLTVDGRTHGDLGRYYDFLRASPLHERLGGLLDHTRAAGEATVAVQLGLPLRDLNSTTVDGDISLDNVQMFYSSLEQPISGINGTVHFDRNGARAEALSARFEDLPLSARIVPRAGTHGVVLIDFPFTPNADGVGASQFLPPLIRATVSGSSQWHGELPISSQPGGTALTLSSDLRGTEVRLPEPLAKPAPMAAPVSVRIGGDADAPLRLAISYAQRATADIAMAPGGDGDTGLSLQGLRVRFGGSAPAAGRGSFIVDGHAGTVDVGAWAGLFAGNGATSTGTDRAGTADAASGRMRLNLIDLDVDHLRWAHQLSGATHVRWQPTAGGWRTTLTGDGAQGAVDWGGPAPGRVTARFDRIALTPGSQSPTVESAEHKAAQAPGGDVPAVDPQTPPAQPAHWPELDLICSSLIGNGSDFGRVELRSSHVAGGQRLDRFKIGGGILDLDASGLWRRLDGRSTAELQVSLQSREFEAVLRALDYEQNVQAKKTDVKATLKWAPSTTGLVWQAAEGRVELHAEDGQLRAVKPGAGRVLGLLNFYALPRRVLLDFSDVVDKGLGFDDIDGHFDLGNGAAVTDDLTIKGPSVKIDMRGRIGLVARDYDQRVSVYPAGMSSGVTLGAALLGGPAVGALVLLAQEVLDKPLDQVTQLTYHVSGSWDNPRVERIESRSLPAAKNPKKKESAKQ